MKANTIQQTLQDFYQQERPAWLVHFPLKWDYSMFNVHENPRLLFRALDRFLRKFHLEKYRESLTIFSTETNPLPQYRIGVMLFREERLLDYLQKLNALFSRYSHPERIFGRNRSLIVYSGRFIRDEKQNPLLKVYHREMYQVNPHEKNPTYTQRQVFGKLVFSLMRKG